MLTVIHLFLFLVSFLLTFKFIKDSNFEKLFKQGKTRTILVASIVVSLIAIVGFAVLLIIGSTLLKNFALISLVGTALNMATIVYVLPSLLKK